jgi:type VI secretion system protein ImpA
MKNTDYQPFAPDLTVLLAPLPGEHGVGISMRYDPAYLVIRQAREQDDPTLPRGEWVRALKKADWPLAAGTAVELLQRNTKDFQLAAWLCEAWIHLHQIEGLNAAILLMQGLVNQYWEHAYPQIDEGDEDARLAPFIWMNENIPLVLSLQLTLVTVPDRKRGAVNLADWDKTLVSDSAADKVQKEGAGDEKPLTRDEILASVRGANLSRLVQLQLQLKKAISGWATLAQSLDARVQGSPPSIARVTEMLRRIERAVITLLDGHTVQEPEPEITLQSPEPDTTETPEEGLTMNTSMHTARSAADMPQQGPIESREDAYRRLEQIADYLMKTEPHSPTPYLIRRAVSWGRMSLVDLMLEVVREEGDMTRYLSLLGIKEVSE